MPTRPGVVYVIALDPRDARAWADRARKGPEVKTCRPDSLIPMRGLHFAESDDPVYVLDDPEIDVRDAWYAVGARLVHVA